MQLLTTDKPPDLKEGSLTLLKQQIKMLGYKKYSKLRQKHLEYILQKWRPGYEDLSVEKIKVEAKHLATREDMLSRLGKCTTR